MSTRATIHFLNEGSDQPQAIVYRHSDGYREGLGKDLVKFCDDLRANLDDTRFNDPSYLAARWIVWDAHNYQTAVRQGNDPHRCDFLGIGVVQNDPPDIEFRYKVFCRAGFDKGVKPRIVCQKVRCGYSDGVWTVEREHILQSQCKRVGTRSSRSKRLVLAPVAQEVA